MDSQKPVIEDLCKYYVDAMKALQKQSTYDACQLLLCANDLEINTTKIQRVLRALENSQPPVTSSSEDLLQQFLRLIVFTRFGTGLDSRRAFLDYWLIQKNYRGKDVITVSVLVNLAIENQELLDLQTRDYVRTWHVIHTNITADRIVAWSIYDLNKVGEHDIARQRADAFLAKRVKNGSWGDDLLRTISCAYPLAISGIVEPTELQRTTSYILTRLERGFVNSIGARAAALKLFYKLGIVPSPFVEWTRRKLAKEEEITNHSTLSKPSERIRRIEKGDLITQNIQAKEQVTMLDPTTVPILLKALDFIFGEGSKILQERRERHKATQGNEKNKSEATSMSKHDLGEVIRSREAALSKGITSIAWASSEAKIKHLLNLLNTYTHNYYLAKEQYAKFGSALVPPIIVHNLTEAEDGIATTIKELQVVLSTVYEKKVETPDAVE